VEGRSTPSVTQRIRVRGRGPDLLQARIVGAVATAFLVLSSLPGSVAVAIGVVGVSWQLWLCRVGVVVTATEVRVRGPIGSWSTPLSGVQSFSVVRRREPLDVFVRSVQLIVHLSDGSERVVRWVAWQDYVTPFLVSTERPVTRSQRTIVDRLNEATDVDASGVEPNPGPA
jgi:hypothetical protein